MNDEELRRWATAPMRIDPVRADRLDHELRALREQYVELEAKSRWVARLWRDWPQQRRDGVRALSGHLHDAIEDLTCHHEAHPVDLTASADHG